MENTKNNITINGNVTVNVTNSTSGANLATPIDRTNEALISNDTTLSELISILTNNLEMLKAAGEEKEKKERKVVEGRSKRVFTDTKGVVDTAVANGYTDLYKKQLITLTEFEKMMGKKKFAELLGKYVTKPPGKLSLVPESDPREAVELNNSPEQEFAAIPDEGE